MILPPHKMKDFTHYIADYEYGTDKNYNNTCHDIIELFYSKEKTFLWMKYRKDWSVKYKFSRINKASNWEISKGAQNFINQLSKAQSEQWTCIDPKVYNKIKTEHPEYLLWK